jgi:hypothetical protein
MNRRATMSQYATPSPTPAAFLVAVLLAACAGAPGETTGDSQEELSKGANVAVTQNGSAVSSVVAGSAYTIVGSHYQYVSKDDNLHGYDLCRSASPPSGTSVSGDIRCTPLFPGRDGTFSFDSSTSCDPGWGWAPGTACMELSPGTWYLIVLQKTSNPGYALPVASTALTVL